MRRIDCLRIPVFFFVSVMGLLALAPPHLLAADSTVPDLLRIANPRPEEVAAYADRLVADARSRRLHESHYWHTLLHYKRGVVGLRSLVDDPRFFASPRGKRDPEAELEATIRSFFDPVPAEGKHPLCRFVARYYWLKEELGLDPAMLPLDECVPFTRLIQEMQPQSTTLVFPTSHMNAPASMFGHTLLTYQDASGNKLLAHAVNYAAVTQETFGPLFAIKGIFGLYRGYFSVLPYYTKLQEYSDIDHRDIWEYRLNFSREETIRSIMHVYEMEGIYSDYYFFDENCSYNLLFALDAGRPSLDLTDRMPPWVIPLETIRAAEKAGIIAEVSYRPSKTTTIEHIGSLLGRSGRLLARDVAEGGIGPERILASGSTVQDKARTLDLAVEYLQYLYSAHELRREAYTDRLVRLLAARSSVAAADGSGYDVPPPPRPEEGHRSGRLQVGAGVRKGQAFQELGFRFAYHTLTDYAAGYLEGSQIVFGDTALRYYFEDRQVRLQRLDLIDIVSLAPRDELFHPLSWKVTAGLTQRVMEDGRDHLIAQISPGAGLAYQVQPLGLCYVMLEADANAGEALRQHYALGLGGSVGIVRGITDRWRASLSGRGMSYGLGDDHSLLEVTLAQSYALTSNFAISLDVAWSKTREFYRAEGKLALNVYF